MIRWTNNLCEYRLSLGACRSSLLHPYRSMYLKSKVTPATRDERTQIFQSRTIKSRTEYFVWPIRTREIDLQLPRCEVDVYTLPLQRFHYIASYYKK